MGRMVVHFKIWICKTSWRKHVISIFYNIVLQSDVMVLWSKYWHGTKVQSNVATYSWISIGLD
jgi:hypothetical protein